MSTKNKLLMMPGSSKSASALIAKKMLTTKNESLSKIFVEYANNSKWISQNRSRIRKNNANRFVAIHNGRVCLRDKNLATLRKKVAKKYKDKQKSVVIDFIGERRVNFLL